MSEKTNSELEQEILDLKEELNEKQERIEELVEGIDNASYDLNRLL